MSLGNIAKYENTLRWISSVFALLISVLDVFEKIPSSIRVHIAFKIFYILLLAFTEVLVIRFIFSKTTLRSFRIYGIALSSFVIFIISVPIFFVKESKSPFPKDSAYRDNSNKPNISIDSVKNLQLVSGSNNTVIQNNHDNSQYFSDNRTTINNYNSLPQRKLNSSELERITSSIISKETKLKISYPSNDKEAQIFGFQIFDKLIDLGYSKLSKEAIEHFQSYSKSERFSIVKNKNPDLGFTLIINPQ